MRMEWERKQKWDGDGWWFASLTHRETLWAECDRQHAHVLCWVFYSRVVKLALDSRRVCVCVWMGGCQFKPEQEVWDPESWESHVRMRPSSALPWQASAPSVLPAGRPARSPPPRHIWTHKGAHTHTPPPPPPAFFASRTSMLTESRTKCARHRCAYDEFVDQIASWWWWCKRDDFRGRMSQQASQLWFDIHTEPHVSFSLREHQFMCFWA